MSRSIHSWHLVTIKCKSGYNLQYLTWSKGGDFCITALNRATSLSSISDMLRECLRYQVYDYKWSQLGGGEIIFKNVRASESERERERERDLDETYFA